MNLNQLKGLSLLLLFSVGCHSGNEKEPSSSTPTNSKDGLLFSIEKVNVTLDNGLYTESPDSNQLFDYSADNKIYVEQRHFKYAYSYVKGGDSLFCSLKNKKPHLEWELIKREHTNDSTIFFINIIPKPFSNIFGSEYKQTIVNIDYLGAQHNVIVGGEKTGCVENYKNVWIHPARGFLFKILELNPFPFIQAPYEKGNEWSGELVIGSSWGDERWVTWDGLITNKYRYEIVDRTDLKVDGMLLNCFVIEAKAKGRLGATSLKSWFSPDYGFVKMNYKNIDDSEIILDRVWR